jgi:hypothetical protein
MGEMLRLHNTCSRNAAMQKMHEKNQRFWVVVVKVCAVFRQKVAANSSKCHLKGHTRGEAHE